ncbi:MAG: hypothetical protein ACK4Y5_06580 [Acetobacteraceae bacterium]|jgi:hypothetical protein
MQDVDTPTEEEVDTPEAEAVETKDEEPEAQETPKEQEPEEITVAIGDETPAEEEQEKAPEWVRDLRKQHRELQRKVREYEAREQVAPKVQTLGPKPTLEQHDYDTERYERSLEAWYRQRDEQAKIEAQAKAKAEEAERAWKSRLDTYGKAKAELKVRDFDDAEAVVLEAFNQTQQGVMLHGADNPAMVVYALGKNPKKAKELAAIADPVRFAFAVAKLESQLKIVPRAKPPAPERSVPVGTAPVSGTADATLERLREQAAKTGDMTAVIRYKQQLKAKQR